MGATRPCPDQPPPSGAPRPGAPVRDQTKSHRVSPLAHDLPHSVHPPEDFQETFATYVGCIELGLNRLLPAVDAPPGRLHAAMRYSMGAGGKRLRPALVLGAAELFDPEGQIDPLPAAVAVECLHTYSLIHDDLPCMDDDDLRRGRPTCHKAFDEATALLAGDALLTLAFTLLATAYAAHPALAVALGRELGTAAGSTRLIGGQMADLLAEKKPDVSAADLEFIHLNKTAAMIEAALVAGALIGGAGGVHGPPGGYGLAFCTQFFTRMIDGYAVVAVNSIGVEFV